ncbi:TPA: acyltransferase family protein [Escherichia coli]|nr:acyltransferase [Escherichia coli]
MVLSIHYLRGVAALFVVLFHLRSIIAGAYAQENLGDILFDYGYFGVDLFFMISGFVIVFSTQNDSSIKSFAIKRFFRIYPIYLIAILISYALSINSYTTSDLYKSLFFIQYDYSSIAPFYGYSMVSAAWTLSYEVVFYFIFTISMLISHKFRAFVCSVFILTLFVINNFIFNNSGDYSAYASINITGPLESIVKITSSQMMIEFVIGMLMCNVFLFIKNNITIKRNFISPLQILALLLSIIMIISPPEYGHGIDKVGIGCFILILSFLSIEITNGMRTYRILMFFANISYSLYLSHLVVYNALNKYMYSIPYISNMHGFSKMSLLLILFITIAWVIHMLIEAPCAKIARIILR